MKEIKLIYTCAAFPPDIVDITKAYYYGKDVKGTYFTDGEMRNYADMWFIKMLFTPEKGNWEEV